MAIISYILFEDEAEAIKFHREWFDESQNNLTEYGTLVASYKYPTRFCNQLDPFPHKRDGWSFRKTRGWWVCPQCLRPSKLIPEARSFELDGRFGYNIMEKIKSAEIGDKL